MPPVSVLIIKLDRCLSPMPRIQWLMQISAWELVKWERRDRKASGAVLILTKALLKEKKSHRLFINVTSKLVSKVSYWQYIYLNRSFGTRFSLFLKDMTVSVRLALLKVKECTSYWNFPVRGLTLENTGYFPGEIRECQIQTKHYSQRGYPQREKAAKLDLLLGIHGWFVSTLPASLSLSVSPTYQPSYKII